MAKFSAHGNKVEAIEASNGILFTLMSDGKILRQYRDSGAKLSAPTIVNGKDGKPYTNWALIKQSYAGGAGRMVSVR